MTWERSLGGHCLDRSCIIKVQFIDLIALLIFDREGAANYC